MKKPELKIKVRQPEYSLAMARTNLTQKEIAVLAGVSEVWYSNMVRGLVGISPKVRRKVIALLKDRRIPAKFDDIFFIENGTTVT